MILFILMVIFFAFMGIVGITLQGIARFLIIGLAIILPFIIFEYLPKSLQDNISSVISFLLKHWRKHPILFSMLFCFGGCILICVLMYGAYFLWDYIYWTVIK